MAKKYRFLFEEFDRYGEKVNGKYQRKDEMLWEYDNLIVGITQTQDHFVINQYSKNFNKSEYTMVSDSYTLDKYVDEWFTFEIAEFEKSTQHYKEKENNV
jgi:hypothetical protein